MTIGQNIRIFRKKRGLSQERLGQLIEMTGSMISSYENEKTVPKRRVIEKIAGALDVPVEKILGDAYPSHSSGRQREEASSALLYDGVLTALKELYGMVEGRMIMGENGICKKYYIVCHPAGQFVLYEKDISAIVSSAKASMPPLVEHMKKPRKHCGQSGMGRSV